MGHRAEFEHLARERLGAKAASQVLWSAPRVVCVAGDFTRYDVHAVREHRRSIDLVRYRLFGTEYIGLETVASVTEGPRGFVPVGRRRVRKFACLKADPESVDLVPGFTRDVSGLSHHGTGDLELPLRTGRDLDRAQEYFRLSYAAA